MIDFLVCDFISNIWAVQQFLNVITIDDILDTWRITKLLPNVSSSIVNLFEDSDIHFDCNRHLAY